MAITLSKGSRITAGVLLLALLAVEFGGYYLTSVVRGDIPLTEFQRTSREPVTRTPGCS